MPRQPVERTAIAVWRWEAIFTSLVIFIAGVIPLFASRVPVGISIGLGGLAFLLLAAWIAWYPGAKYRHLGWHLDDVGITIHAGIFWRTQSSLARARIQHTDVFQGPLQRHYGVATLKLYTAGSHFSRIELPGLSHDTAIHLRDALQSADGSDAV